LIIKIIYYFKIKKMKFTKYIIIALSTLFIMSCSSDFLTENPKDDIFADNLLNDYTGYVSMQNALMALVRDEYDRVDQFYGATEYPSLPMAKSLMFTVGADNAFCNNRHNRFVHWNFPKNLTNMADFDPFQAIFEWLYTVINTSNMIITRAETSDIDWKGPNNKNTVIANAKIIRAWAYRHLTYSFGDVPLSTEEITGSNYRSDWERTPVAEIRKVMEEDLLFAVQNLPMRASSNSHLSQAVARHYLGELYLAMSKNTEAKNILQPLVEGSEFKLMTSRFGPGASRPGNVFMDLFRSPKSSSGNMEVLWVFNNTEPENSAFGVGNRVFMRNMWVNYYSRIPLIANLQHSKYPGQNENLFWSLNGGKGATRASMSVGAINLYNYNLQASKDIRYDEHSMVWKLYYLNEANVVYELKNTNGTNIINTTITSRMTNDADVTVQNYLLPSTRKWEYLHPFFEKASIDEQFNDIVYLRLAETYLLYAEALFKLGQNGSEWVNKIRERAGVSPISAGEMSINLILDERSRELITEEHRRHTLVRLSQENGGDVRKASNVFKTRTRMHNEVTGRPVRGMHDDETPILFPIPQAFINSNTGRMIQQNPGIN
jgi:starch-binding outer membrane protein, SusD/RagB family